MLNWLEPNFFSIDHMMLANSSIQQTFYLGHGKKVSNTLQFLMIYPLAHFYNLQKNYVIIHALQNYKNGSLVYILEHIIFYNG